MWELDHKEGWALKNCCFWTVVLEKTLESPLKCKEIQPVHPKGYQSWIFIGRTDAEAPIFCHLWRANLLEKTLVFGKTEGRRRREWQRMRWFGWHHQFNGHEFEQTLKDGERQGSLVCCSPQGHTELGMAEWLNNKIKRKLTNCIVYYFFVVLFLR